MMVTERILVPHDHSQPIGEYSNTIAELYQLEGAESELPITITFQVTEDCNLSCTYCYQICKSKKHMTLDVAKKTIDIILTDEKYIKVSQRVACILDFIGGEPLLEIDLIEQIYQYFLKKCFEMNHPWLTRHRISICSNGVLYNTEKVQKFMSTYGINLSMAITIDGPKELHDACRIFPDGTGSHDIVEESVKTLRRQVPSLGTKVTIAPENLQYLGKSVRYMREELGLTEIHANCTFEGPWHVDNAKLLYDEMVKLSDYCYDNDTYSTFNISLFDESGFTGKDYSVDDQNWCGGTGSMFAVDPDGNFYPCLRYMKSSLGDNVEPYIIGNIDRGVRSSECDKYRCDFLDSITATSQSTEECINCPIAGGCAWCSAYNYQKTGSVNKRVTEICIMHKARSLANVYYWNKFYEKHNVPNVYENYLPKEDAISIIGEEEYNKLMKLIEDQRKRIEVK